MSVSLYVTHARRCRLCAADKPGDGCSNGLAIWSLEAQTVVDRAHITELETARARDAEAFADLDRRLTVALTEAMDSSARETDALDTIAQLRERLAHVRAETARPMRARPPVASVLRRFPRP